jgi:mono/diheme cytochrome c family protein
MMKTICTFFLVFVMTSAAASAQGDVAVGQKVYAAQKCVACHSIAGVGNKRGALDDVASKLSADQIRQWITNAPDMAAKAQATRKPVMKAYSLPKEELDGLLAYLQTLK